MALIWDTKREGCNSNTPQLEKIVELASSKRTHPPSMSMSMDENEMNKIHACLRNTYMHLHTPDHPPYSQMIFKAINSLNYEEGGANKAAISAYIKSEFHDLAWAHESLLSHHLGKLLERGELVTSPSTGDYQLPKPLLLAHEDLDPSKHAQGRGRRGRPPKPKRGNKESMTKRESLSLCEQRKKQGINKVSVEEDGNPKKRRGRPPKKLISDNHPLGSF
ncbi:unnamed protein product [Prunus armeniaca]|uniref:H15 domain-containing protein n=1 Tax=Prunus armeniaca TaxID=36596 RepID=A0A6J5XIJ9_PRUAR|nr:hypothetical protein GBA52_017924 [Prunus armeniaca]CAB4311792.1 unnamed protein product [Prunus armeniaca]